MFGFFGFLKKMMHFGTLFFNTTLWILLLQPLHGQSVITFSTAVVTVVCPKNQTTKKQTKKRKRTIIKIAKNRMKMRREPYQKQKMQHTQYIPIFEANSLLWYCDSLASLHLPKMQHTCWEQQPRLFIYKNRITISNNENRRWMKAGERKDEQRERVMRKRKR